MAKHKPWGYDMDDTGFLDIVGKLSSVYKDTYKDTYNNDWADMVEAAEPKQKYDHADMLREVMHELHKQGDGLDTLMALKNDELREWWSTELAKIKKEEAKSAAREKAKSLLSEEERKLLGMKF